MNEHFALTSHSRMPNRLSTFVYQEIPRIGKMRRHNVRVPLAPVESGQLFHVVLVLPLGSHAIAEQETCRRAVEGLHVFFGTSSPPIVGIRSGGLESGNLNREFQVYASPEKAGVWRLDSRAMSQQIVQIRGEYPNALIIAFPHWGWSYAWKDATQEEIAHAIIDAGADLILGHGAHHLQEIETQQGRWIVYGLGNFMFNTRGLYGRKASPPYSLVGRLVLRESGDSLAVTLRLYPIVSDNGIVDYQPRPVDTEEFSAVKALLRIPLPAGTDDIGQFFELPIRKPAKSPTPTKASPLGLWKPDPRDAHLYANAFFFGDPRRHQGSSTALRSTPASSSTTENGC